MKKKNDISRFIICVPVVSMRQLCRERKKKAKPTKKPKQKLEKKS